MSIGNVFLCLPRCLRGIFFIMVDLLTGTSDHHLDGGPRGCLSNLAGCNLLTPSSVSFLNVFFSGASSESTLEFSNFARFADSLQIAIASSRLSLFIFLSLLRFSGRSFLAI